MSIATGKLRSAVAGLPPGYFAMVMATGIISIASHLLGMTTVATVLFAFNIAFFVVLWLLLLGRIVFYTRNFWADLREHSRGAGYFTTVAGACVLGNQFVTLYHALIPALLFLFFGALLWFPLIYGIFALFTVREDKPTLEKGINGTWLVAVVATQSISILSGAILSELSIRHDVLAFFSVCAFLVGCMLYIMIITLIFYRFMFFEFKPVDLSHPYWINMGAVAITTLAGTVAIRNGASYHFLNGLVPFTTGFTLFFWATATWWIPFLVVMGVWRFIIHRQKIFYDPQYWTVVFPLGMYTTCTFRLAETLDLPFLTEVSRFFILAALASWALVFCGLVLTLVRR